MASVSKEIVAVEMARLARSPRQHMVDLIADLLVTLPVSFASSRVASSLVALHSVCVLHGVGAASHMSYATSVHGRW